jgi:hypothetical protein
MLVALAVFVLRDGSSTRLCFEEAAIASGSDIEPVEVK